MEQINICKSVIIVGGGTAGWMTAASLSYRLKSLGIKIILVESPDISTIGVGEATVPSIKNYFSSLDLDVSNLMKETNATFKLGIEFDGWKSKGHSFFHPFGRYGVTAQSVGFQHLFQNLKNNYKHTELKQYSLGTQLAYLNKFGMQNPSPQNDFEYFDWAIHFDAHLFAKYLAKLSISNGVEHIQAKVNEITKDELNGNIKTITLDNGQKLSAELFIDCTGIRSLLLQGAMETGYNDWGNFLFCNRAVAIGCEHKNKKSITPYTRSQAQSSGWTWRIPLQNRIGNGYVYSSNYIDDNAALDRLLMEIDGGPINQPNFVKYTTGHAKKVWNKNCLAIGLSAGFLEPLESTSIALIQMAIDKLIEFWPSSDFDERVISEYNRISVLEYERIRDFIILHYKLNNRENEDFWNDCRNMEIPDTLRHKIDLFKSRGHFVQYDWESFFVPSWHCMYEGFGVEIENIDPRSSFININELKQTSNFIKEDIKNISNHYPTHVEFIKENCASSDFIF